MGKWALDVFFHGEAKVLLIDKVILISKKHLRREKTCPEKDCVKKTMSTYKQVLIIIYNKVCMSKFLYFFKNL